jgi:hypothetical protein
MPEEENKLKHQRESLFLDADDSEEEALLNVNSALSSEISYAMANSEAGAAGYFYSQSDVSQDIQNSLKDALSEQLQKVDSSENSNGLENNSVEQSTMMSQDLSSENPIKEELNSLIEKASSLTRSKIELEEQENASSMMGSSAAFDGMSMLSNEVQNNSETQNLLQSTMESDSNNSASQEISDNSVKVSEKDQLLHLAFKFGRKKGNDLGRSVGLGKKVETDENDKTIIGENFKDREAALTYSNLEKTQFFTEINAENNGEHAELIKSKKIEGFHQGFNEGYQTAVRMKLEMNRLKTENSSDFQLGKEKGTEAGAHAANGDSAKANDLKSEADQHPSSEYRQGFYKAFNDSYQAKKNRSIQNQQAEDLSISENNEDYQQGFNAGEELAAEYVSGIISQTDYQSELTGTPKDQPLLFQKGFSAGINSGYFKAKQSKLDDLKQEAKGPKADDPDYIHFLAGSILGNLAAQSSKEEALKLLVNGDQQASLLESDDSQIPDIVFDYFQAQEHEKIYLDEKGEKVDAQNSYEASLFEEGYFSSFNKIYHLQKNQKIALSKPNIESDEYQKGYELGMVSFDAQEQLALIDSRIKEEESALSPDSKLLEELKDLQDQISKKLNEIVLELNSASPDFRAAYYEAYNHRFHELKNKKYDYFFNSDQSFYVEEAEGLLSSELKEEAGTDTHFQRFYVEGYNLAYQKYYKFSTGTEQMDPALLIKKRIDRFKKNLTEENEEEEDPKEKISNLSSKIDGFFEVFKKGIKKGQEKGIYQGKSYLNGFEDALSGKDKQSGELFYLKGFYAGAQEKDYEDFRSAVLQKEGLNSDKNTAENKRDNKETETPLPFEKMDSNKADALYQQLQEKIKEES